RQISRRVGGHDLERTGLPRSAQARGDAGRGVGVICSTEYELILQGSDSATSRRIRPDRNRTTLIGLSIAADRRRVPATGRSVRAHRDGMARAGIRARPDCDRVVGIDPVASPGTERNVVPTGDIVTRAQAHRRIAHTLDEITRRSAYGG